MISKTSTRAIRRAGLLALFATVPMLAVADDDNGWYIGLNWGESQATIDNQQIMDELIGGGFTSASIVDDDRDDGYKVFAGYQFGANLAIEAVYFDLGKFGFDATTVPAGTLSGDVQIDGFSFDVIGSLPLGDRLSAFGRLGANVADAASRFTGTGAVVVPTANFSEANVNYKLGLGLQYDLGRSWSVRLEGERYRIDDSVGNEGDVDLYSLGVLYRFGRRHDNEPVVSEPVAAPAPTPVLVIVPVVAQTQRYCSILDLQFTINNDELYLRSAEKLGVLGTFMTKYPETTAVIEGHTDNVGSAADNQALSVRRAQSVVDYLVDEQKVARSRLTAVGYGSTRPIADNSTPEGQRANRRIGAVVACATDLADLHPVKARVTMALQMDFDAEGATVRPEYRDELRKVASFMIANPAMRANVEGHTGALQATPELAMKMSQQRAQAVVDYLVTQFNVPRSQLTAEGFGQTRRFAYNTSIEGPQQNRRVNIILEYPE